ncbi:hypothetical protein [Psychromonas algicola]|uniref:hypothetical protein n=1 Tax=Psychromonas algicola TaxID=2555642 RepID=UPI0010685774|nr:hypothetical protein [Psychromonas sp. RZ5]TEW49009.1 hypothetical protein E2R67_11225 [Psychromonas sp. RZ5]
MKVTCPHCQVNLDVKKIPVTIPQGIHIQRQCTSCQAWFRLKPLQNKLKIVGIVLLLMTSLCNFMVTDSNTYLLLSATGFVGILMALIITFYGQQEKIPAPPKS